MPHYEMPSRFEPTGHPSFELRRPPHHHNMQQMILWSLNMISATHSLVDVQSLKDHLAARAALYSLASREDVSPGDGHETWMQDPRGARHPPSTS